VFLREYLWLAFLSCASALNWRAPRAFPIVNAALRPLLAASEFRI
jgi:hypothetical protein